MEEPAIFPISTGLPIPRQNLVMSPFLDQHPVTMEALCRANPDLWEPKQSNLPGRRGPKAFDSFLPVPTTASLFLRIAWIKPGCSIKIDRRLFGHSNV